MGVWSGARKGGGGGAGASVCVCQWDSSHKPPTGMPHAPPPPRHPLASDKADSTKWIPNVVFNPASQLFVMWGGSGDWFVATSKDGVNFDLVTPHTTSRLGGGTDGTGLFIDDDGVGYIAFADTDHYVSIERLAPDLLSSTKVNVSGFFPDDYVEVGVGWGWGVEVGMGWR